MGNILFRDPRAVVRDANLNPSTSEACRDLNHAVRLALLFEGLRGVANEVRKNLYQFVAIRFDLKVIRTSVSMKVLSHGDASLVEHVRHGEDHGTDRLMNVNNPSITTHPGQRPHVVDDLRD